MNNIIITGGAGFVGSNLCEKLISEKNKIICFDNLYTGRIENIKHFMTNKNFTFIEGDINISSDVKKLYSNKNIDQIYNLACPASPPAYQKDPIRTIKTSTIGVINILELATKYNSRILQASTSEVYGDPDMHPQKESYWGNVNPIGIRSCYDEGKRSAECLFMDYHREKNTDIRIIRIFNTYGPNMDPNDGRVVSNFIVQALQNKNITIYGNGKQTRSFQYVSDLIEGMYKMMSTENFIGPVNIGNPGEFTMMELADKVIKMTGSKSKIVYKNLPSDDPKKRCPDITLAKEKLNWSPKISLDEGLKPTIEYFKKQVKSK